MVNTDLVELLEIARRHELEVNAGVTELDIPMLDEYASLVYPKNQPILAVSEGTKRLNLDEVKPTCNDTEEPAMGYFRGFYAIEEKLETDGYDDLGRIAIGILLKDFNDCLKVGHWVPCSKVLPRHLHDVYESVADLVIADDFFEALAQEIIDVNELAKLCRRLPNDPDVMLLFSALIQSYVGPGDLIDKVYLFPPTNYWGACRIFTVEDAYRFYIYSEDGGLPILVIEGQENEFGTVQIPLIPGEFGYDRSPDP